MQEISAPLLGGNGIKAIIFLPADVTVALCHRRPRDRALRAGGGVSPRSGHMRLNLVVDSTRLDTGATSRATTCARLLYTDPLRRHYSIMGGFAESTVLAVAISGD